MRNRVCPRGNPGCPAGSGGGRRGTVPRGAPRGAQAAQGRTAGTDGCAVLGIERAFDLVGAFDVLEHIDRDEEALRGMYTALRPGGGLVVTVPQHRWLWSEADSFADHARRYTRGELTQRMHDAGFELLWATSFLTFLLPLVSTSRLLTRRRSYSLEREFSLPHGSTGFSSDRSTSSAQRSHAACPSPREDRCSWWRGVLTLKPMREIPFNRPLRRGGSSTTSARRSTTGTSPGTARSPSAARVARASESGATRALLTHSCTAALEMAAMLAEIEPGDEVDHAVVHVRLDRQRLRRSAAARRCSSTSARTR